jgi:hypothetical protein
MESAQLLSRYAGERTYCAPVLHFGGLFAILVKSWKAVPPQQQAHTRVAVLAVALGTAPQKCCFSPCSLSRTIGMHVFDASSWFATGHPGRPKLECGITFEPYTQRWPRRPVFLPDCGHTFSEAAVQSLLRCRSDISASIRCPDCRTEQPSLRLVDDAPPNWEIIKLLKKAEDEAIFSEFLAWVCSF